MKIGVLTFHRAVNYGAQLQAWALQHFLRDFGHTCFVIDYRCKTIEENYKFFSWTKFKEKKVKSKFLYLMNQISHYYDIKRRNQKFDVFLSSSIDLLPMSELEGLETVICGSDQIWNPYLTGGLDRIYTLLDDRFNNVNKVAYAISGEPQNLRDANVIDNIKKSINSYSAISFREFDLTKMFQSHYEGLIKCCVDPTFLVDKIQWKSFSGENPILKCKYLFVYQVVYSKECLSIAKQIAKQKNLKLYYLNSSFKFGRSEKNLHFDIGPKEFVNLIANADFIVTTSFHGTAMSIIMQKQFLFVPIGHTNRQIQLLKSLNLEDRIAKTNIINMDDIDYEKLSIIEYRASSVQFLKNSIRYNEDRKN